MAPQALVSGVPDSLKWSYNVTQFNALRQNDEYLN